MKHDQDCDKILVVSTYDADQNIVSVVKITQSFGPILRSQTNNLKNQSLGTKKGSAKKLMEEGVKNYRMLIQSHFVMIGIKSQTDERRL